MLTRRNRALSIWQLSPQCYSFIERVHTTWETLVRLGLARLFEVHLANFEVDALAPTRQLGFRTLDDRRLRLRAQQRKTLLFRDNNRLMNLHAFNRHRNQLFVRFNPYNHWFPRFYPLQEVVAPFSLDLGGVHQPTAYW